jgi:hypothetical protein
MKPTVGRIVHYTSLGDRDGKYPPEAQAALITKVVLKDSDAEFEESRFSVSLHVFYEDGGFNMKNVPFTISDAGTEEARGKWTWPARGS